MRKTTGGLLIERFWEKVNKTKTCWLWTGMTYFRKKINYGKMQICSVDRSTHRISWEIHNGRIPKGMCVLHKCDIPLCVRPDHLWLGTAAENCADRANKGRNNHASGERVKSSKLKKNQIPEIRSLYSSGRFTHQQIATRYNVNRKTIGNIVNGLIWKHI